MDAEAKEDSTKARGYSLDSAGIANLDPLAKKFGFGFKILEKEKIEGAYDANNKSEIILGVIKNRVKENEPTIAKLAAGNLTHFVVIVGLRSYRLLNGEETTEYIINDPGRANKKNSANQRDRFTIDSESRNRADKVNSANQRDRFTIDSKSRKCEHWGRTIDAIYSLKPE